MDELTRRAMLGDREAQKELTKQSRLIPCQCGGKVVIDDVRCPEFAVRVRCLMCGNQSVPIKGNITGRSARKKVVKLWNTRPPLVVFCKDCVHYDGGSCEAHSAYADEYSTGYDFRPDDYDFCSMGKRRNTDE